jgi:diguanylate cyclase (GGDEF)-like protein
VREGPGNAGSVMREEYECLVGPRCVIWSASCFLDDGPSDVRYLAGRACHRVFRRRETPCPECPLYLEDPSFFHVHAFQDGNAFDCTARSVVGDLVWSIPLETNPLSFVPVGVCVADMTGRPLFWNAEWRRITGEIAYTRSLPAWMRNAGGRPVRVRRDSRKRTSSVVSIRNDTGIFARIPGEYRCFLAWDDGTSGGRCGTDETDALTGLRTRASFDGILREADGSPETLSASLLALDIDGLQTINDVFGTDRGDAVLRHIADVLRGACRAKDVIARIGEDEFCVLLPGVGPDFVRGISERISAIAGCPTEGIPYGFSTGCASRTTGERPMSELLQIAEERMLRQKRGRRGSMHNALLQTIETMMEETSRETKGHADRLRALCAGIGKALRLDDAGLEILDLVARLHDIGKISVPLSILSKSGPLSEEEWRVIRRHPDVGFRIARASSPDIASAADGIRGHHERWDGTGYPLGLSGRAIPLAARIVSIADAYDAMRSERPYKPPFGEARAREELVRCAGSQFDPDLVPVFLEVLDILRGPGV